MSATQVGGSRDFWMSFFKHRLHEVDDCCSLICYYGIEGLETPEGIEAMMETAKTVDRKYGMFVQVVFNRSWARRNEVERLEEAGFSKMAEYPAAHDPGDTVLIYGKNTGQQPH